MEDKPVNPDQEAFDAFYKGLSRDEQLSPSRLEGEKFEWYKARRKFQNKAIVGRTKGFLTHTSKNFYSKEKGTTYTNPPDWWNGWIDDVEDGELTVVLRKDNHEDRIMTLDVNKLPYLKIPKATLGQVLRFDFAHGTFQFLNNKEEWW